MSTSTFALDSANSYRFLGHGTHTPCYEKGFPLDNWGGSLSTANFNALVDELSLFSWMRMLVGGGEEYRHTNRRVKNYNASTQASLLSAMNLRGGPWRYIITPFAAPGVAAVGGENNTRNFANSYSGTATVSTPMAHLGTDEAYQACLDALAESIQNCLNQGCNVEVVGSPSEAGVPNVLNEWLTLYSTTQAVNWVKKVWLGTGMTGGGIIDRFPWLKLIGDDTAGGVLQSYLDAYLADATTAAAIDYYGRHEYGSLSGINTTTGIYDQHKWFFAECGGVSSLTGSWTNASVTPYASALCRSMIYHRAKVNCHWTSLRDVTVKYTSNYQGGQYTAKPLFNLTTASNNYAATPWWYILKPHLLACGRGEADILRAASSTSDTNFEPVTSCWHNLYKRTGTRSVGDNKWGVVYSNFTGSSRSDTIAFTLGGSATNLTGRRKDFSVLSLSEGSWSNISTTAGSYALGTVPTETVVLLELS